MQKQSSSDLVVIVTVTLSQLNNIDLILAGLDTQTILPKHVVFVFDRVNPVNINTTTKPYQIHCIRPIDPVNLPRGDSYCNGYVRNCGIEYVESNIDEYSGFVFIDGDCVPQPELIESHEYVSNYHNIPVISCGKRREKSIGWRDRRELLPQTRAIGMFTRDLLINNNQLILDGFVTWGCNLAINCMAISMIRRLNELYYGESTVFNSIFDGAWGGEDTFIGIQATVARIFIHVPKRGGVECIEQNTIQQSTANDSAMLVTQTLNSFRIKLANNPLPLSFFKNSRERNPIDR